MVRESRGSWSQVKLGTAPAAGANFSMTITEENSVWALEAIEIPYTASAAVANRNVDIVYTTNTDVEIGRNVFRTSITASQVVKIHIGRYVSTLPTDTATDHYHQIPAGLELPDGFKIKTVVAGIQVADQIAAPTIVYRPYAKKIN